MGRSVRRVASGAGRDGAQESGRATGDAIRLRPGPSRTRVALVANHGGYRTREGRTVCATTEPRILRSLKFAVGSGSSDGSTSRGRGPSSVLVLASTDTWRDRLDDLARGVHGPGRLVGE